MLRLWWRQHFAERGKVLRLRIAASTASDQRDHFRWSGRVVRFAPLSLLVYAGSRRDQSDDRATLDGLKHFRLSRAWISDRAQLGSSLPRVNRTGWPDAPTDVPAHRGFREYPCNGGRGAAHDAGMS
jgi:hypothetical protein